MSAIWSTATFRFTIGLSLFFALGSACLLLGLNFAVMRFSEHELNEALQHQMAIMRADVTLEGGAALANVLQEHSRADEANRYRFRVVEVDGQVFSYGLEKDVEAVSGFGNIPLRKSPENKPQTTSIRVLTEVAEDGTFMAVGRDTHELAQLHRALTLVAIWGSLGLLLIALFAGSVTGWLFLKRIERFNTASAQIIDTQLTARLPDIGFGQEFKTLAANLNRMLDRLEAALESMRQVSADLAHDLRTPITRLRTQLETAQFSKGRSKGAAIAQAIHETDEVLRLFSALMRLSQVTSGDARRSFLEVNISEIAASAVDTYLPAIEESGRTLQTDLAPDIRLKGDPVLLGQLIINLLDNAMLHTPVGTVIIVALRRSSTEVVLSVADTGMGVPESEYAQIVKRFYRLDTSRTVPGHGLGLPLVGAIAKLHGGQMEVMGNAPGLKIEITLPA